MRVSLARFSLVTALAFIASLTPALLASANAQMPLTITDKGMGGITAETPFLQEKLEAILWGYRVTKDYGFSEGSAYQIFTVRGDGEELAQIIGNRGSTVLQIMALSNQVRTERNFSFGASYADIYGQANAKVCIAGEEEEAGKVICQAPQAPHIFYIFTGTWDGPDGTLPPADIVRSWRVDQFGWRATPVGSDQE